jgi:hypothetical protein
VSDVESSLGRRGKLNGQVYAVSVPRAETDRAENELLPSGMGLETALNFQQVGDKIATTGDFVLIASEVNPVIKTLQQHGIESSRQSTTICWTTLPIFSSCIIGRWVDLLRLALD